MKIAVNEYAFDEEANGSVVRNLAESSETPVFIRGNISDIMPNIQVVITTDDGKTQEYYPSLSLENGYLRRENLMRLYDFACSWSTNAGGSLYDFILQTEIARSKDSEKKKSKKYGGCLGSRLYFKLFHLIKLWTSF